MNVNYSVEGAKYGISFGTALAIAAFHGDQSLFRLIQVLPVIIGK